LLAKDFEWNWSAYSCAVDHRVFFCWTMDVKMVHFPDLPIRSQVPLLNRPVQFGFNQIGLKWSPGSAVERLNKKIAFVSEDVKVW
jgi:hypothetical protein